MSGVTGKAPVQSEPILSTLCDLHAFMPRGPRNHTLTLWYLCSAALELFDRSVEEFLLPQMPAVPSGAGYGATTDKTWEKTQEQLQDTSKVCIARVIMCTLLTVQANTICAVDHTTQPTQCEWP